jgi:hypothetical protein
VLANQHQRVGQAVQSDGQAAAFFAKHLLIVLELVMVFSKR